MEVIKNMDLNNYLKNLETIVNIDSGSHNKKGIEEVISFLKGEVSYEKMVDLIKQHSRNYAKRQLTFLRGMEEVNYVDVENKKEISSMEEKIKRWLNG